MNNTIKTFIKDILFFCLIIFTCYFVTQHIAQRVVVEGASMNPTFTDGSDLIMSRISYIENDPKRGDIIVFPYNHSHVYFIKRVIGLPGETIQIKDGAVYINGELLQEDYILEPVLEGYEGRATDLLLLGEDEYFVMGDNRNNSLDSRFDEVGNLKKEDLIGKVVFRVTPFDAFGKIGEHCVILFPSYRHLSR